MRSAWLRGLPLLLLLIGAAWAGTSLPACEGARLSHAEIYRRTLRGVAWVHSPDAGKGTGWIIDRPRRLLVTCAHIVGDNKTVDIVFPVHAGTAVVADRAYYFEHMTDLRADGTAVRGRVLKRNPEVDLALVELESLPVGVEELRLAEDSARPGDRVQIVGCRYDVDSLWVHSGGAVSQVETLRKGYFSNGKELAKGARIVSAQVPINEGDSGGPLVNERGEVVGVTAAVAWEEHGAGLFIDVAEVRTFAEPISPIGNIEPITTHFLLKSFAPREVYRQGLRSLALVRTDGERRFSGWLFDRSRRLLLTTAEAVGKHETVDVVFPIYQGGAVILDAAAYRDELRLLKEKGALMTGTILATDARRNLAVLELESVPESATEVRFAEESPAPGDSLHALSNPYRLDVLWVYTACAVRQLGRANLGQTTEGPDPAVLIVQAPLTEGDGGGPLLNDRAELVGVVTGKTGPQQQVAFCLTLDEVRAFLNENRLRWEPESARALVQRGAVFLKARQFARAHADFEAALRLDAHYAPAWCERGRAFYHQGDDDAAARDCGRAIVLDPKLVTPYIWRAAALSRKGEQQKAVADCDAALAADPQSAMAYAVRGNAYRLLGDLARAQKDCDDAVWLDRQLPCAYLYRGQVYAQKGDLELAIADYSRALQFDEYLSEAHRCRGDAEWQKSDVAAALKDYDQALALNPKDALALQGRDHALAARRRPKR
jgi:S1-C subfamily serine protease/Tfp pilus assembly protein PilF